MLKRITVLGADDKELQAIEKKVKAKDVQLVGIQPDASLSGLSDAIINHQSASEAIDLSIQQADRALVAFELLAEAIDCRESFKPESSKRLVKHATRFARALDLSQDDQILLERAALLRDIGKLRIPNEVLLKEGLLNFDEWSLIQNHTNIGADMVAEIDGLQDLAEIIRCHHECYDGDGYPNKLEGEKIPYLARALKVVDVYCAMTSPRSYRTSVSSSEDAIAHLENESGKHFDADLVKIFIDKKVGDEKSND